MRSDDDIATPLHLATPFSTGRRRVTACGTFAHAARDHTKLWAHTKFFAPASRTNPERPAPGVCRSCIELLGVPIEPIGTIFERLGVETTRQAA